jgi:hypothetical protein
VPVIKERLCHSWLVWFEGRKLVYPEWSIARKIGLEEKCALCESSLQSQNC